MFRPSSFLTAALCLFLLAALGCASSPLKRTSTLPIDWNSIDSLVIAPDGSVIFENDSPENRYFFANKMQSAAILARLKQITVYDNSAMHNMKTLSDGYKIYAFDNNPLPKYTFRIAYQSVDPPKNAKAPTTPAETDKLLAKQRKQFQQTLNLIKANATILPFNQYLRYKNQFTQVERIWLYWKN